jgi:histidinol-phosphate aminotransferase
MGKLTRRQLLLGGGAVFGSGFLPGIGATPFTPAIGLQRNAHAAEIQKPAYLIRAGTNENPWGPSRVALQAINGAIDLANQYGGIHDEMLALLARLEDVAEDQIAIGSGSGEILKVAGLLASMHEGSVVCADPTYQDLVRYAGRAGSEIIRVPVSESLHIDLEAMASAIRADTRIVYIVNPNNPSPSIVEKNKLRDFVVEISKDRLVFVDEAYHEFVDNPEYGSMMELIRNGQKNVIVARTASKIHGLAGLRIGFGFAAADLVREIDNRKTGQVNILGMKAAYASYQDEEFQNFTIRKNKESLSIVQGMFEEIGARYVRSNTNFTFFETGHDVEEVNARMLEHGIYTGRPFPPFLTWSRVSMAKPDDMQYYVQTYKKLFA